MGRTFKNIFRVDLLRVALLRDWNRIAHLLKVDARTEVLNACRHDGQQLLGICSRQCTIVHAYSRGSRRSTRIEEWFEGENYTDLFDFILQLGDAVHMREFLQHCALLRVRRREQPWPGGESSGP